MEVVEKLERIASCDRGSESATRKINRFPSRDRRERYRQPDFSGLLERYFTLIVNGISRMIPPCANARKGSFPIIGRTSDSTCDVSSVLLNSTSHTDLLGG